MADALKALEARDADARETRRELELERAETARERDAHERTRVTMRRKAADADAERRRLTFLADAAGSNLAAERLETAALRDELAKARETLEDAANAKANAEARAEACENAAIEAAATAEEAKASERERRAEALAREESMTAKAEGLDARVRELVETNERLAKDLAEVRAHSDANVAALERARGGARRSRTSANDTRERRSVSRRSCRARGPNPSRARTRCGASSRL